jgi:hypothetical protein
VLSASIAVGAHHAVLAAVLFHITTRSTPGRVSKLGVLPKAVAHPVRSRHVCKKPKSALLCITETLV